MSSGFVSDLCLVRPGHRPQSRPAERRDGSLKLFGPESVSKSGLESFRAHEVGHGGTDFCPHVRRDGTAENLNLFRLRHDLTWLVINGTTSTLCCTHLSSRRAAWRQPVARRRDTSMRVIVDALREVGVVCRRPTATSWSADGGVSAHGQRPWDERRCARRKCISCQHQGQTGKPVQETR